MPRVIFEHVVVQHFVNATSLPFCKYTSIRFFEILLIEKGSGLLKINNHYVPYSENQIFVLIPNDKYTFEIETPTTISAIKFLNSFFAELSSNSDQLPRKDWFKKIEEILYSTSRTAHLQLQSDAEESSMRSLFTVLCNEYSDKSLNSEVVLKATLHAMLNIVSRNMSYISAKGTESKIQDIIDYIHHHIHDAEKLSRKTLASTFYFSENYISEFFKREMGISLKKYILNYKLKLVETRLKYTNLTVSEIAHELGFTDSSHLAKTFQAYKGMSVGNYRASAQNTDHS
ncbi:hypothetical protein BKI52_30365 [marine bacterium AO1-C]|nr:hypothetical protein BKI52_30365 [marine bacterium AO1-C]